MTRPMPPPRARKLARAVLCLALLPLAAAADPLPKGDRRIGFGFPVGHGAPSTWRNFEVGKRVGMEYWVVGASWGDLVDRNGRPRQDALKGYEQLMCRAGLKVYLSISPFRGRERAVPAFFTTFDDPAMADAYVALAREVIGLFPEAEILGFLVGHEIERPLEQGPPGGWTAYARFLERVVDGLRRSALLPRDAFVGSSAGLHALTVSHVRQLQRINAHATAVFVSYMPRGNLAIGSLEGPERVARDFQALVDLYGPGSTAWPGPARIAFAEIGYPASSRSELLNREFLRSRCAGRYEGCGEKIQEEFIAQVFRAWDRHAAQVKHMTFTLLHDPPPKAIKATERGVTGAQVRYFEQIGLRSNEPTGLGSDKPAFERFRAEVTRRGWLQDVAPPACHVHPRSTAGPDATPIAADNCLLAANPPPYDCDADGDGFGNACDCDFDQDLRCDARTDGAILSHDIQAGMGAAPPLETDMNCDGVVDADDFHDHFFYYLANVHRPGPSGLPDADGDGLPDAFAEARATRAAASAPPSAPAPRSTGCQTLRPGAAPALLLPVWLRLRRPRERRRRA